LELETTTCCAQIAELRKCPANVIELKTAAASGQACGTVVLSVVMWCVLAKMQ
jgi:hypothetical protein